jgi:hypothetical protein
MCPPRHFVSNICPIDKKVGHRCFKDFSKTLQLQKRLKDIFFLISDHVAWGQEGGDHQGQNTESGCPTGCCQSSR